LKSLTTKKSPPVQAVDALGFLTSVLVHIGLHGLHVSGVFMEYIINCLIMHRNISFRLDFSKI